VGNFVTQEVVVLADNSVGGEGAEYRPSYSWLEDYLVRLEKKAASKESLDAREYHALIASLLA
jgi:hypothetical protein